MKQALVIESVLFTAGEPVSLTELAGLVGVSKSELQSLLKDLQESYRDRGVRVVFDSRSAQLVSAPEAGKYVARYVQSELRGKLSPSALETLAIVAYRGPITRPDIERIRGVNSAQSLRTLAVRGLISDVGRKREPGRPILYDSTLELLKHLGVSGKDELPKLPDDLLKRLERLPQEQTVPIREHS